MRRLAIALLALLAGCATSLDNRHNEGPDLAAHAGWSWQVIPAGMFTLATASRPTQIGETLTVYIEGDGFAYVRPTQPSSDPTPTDPLALRLAIADHSSHPVAWLGRPCQYTPSPSCSTAYWTTARFAPEVVESLNAALDTLKQRMGATHLILVGYSGGGGLAVLLSARRSDVAGIVTVAGLLDVGYWVNRDGYTPLFGSLDPADVASQLGSMPQVHFTGADDSTIGTDVARAFMARLPAGNKARLIEVPDFTHACCWAVRWPELQRKAGVW